MNYHPNHKVFKIIGNITTSKIELEELLKAWVALSIAFAILMTVSQGIYSTIEFSKAFIIAGLTIGIGFLFHELAHKVVAQKYGCRAEFRSFPQMLWLAIIMSFFGFIFAAPGAVFIQGHVTKNRNGMISVAGITTNFILAVLFIMIKSIAPDGIIADIGAYGAFINILIGLFNLIPFGNFDGSKVLAWNKVVYGSMIAVGFVLFALNGMVQ